MWRISRCRLWMFSTSVRSSAQRRSRPGRLDLDPIWKLTLEAAKSGGLESLRVHHVRSLPDQPTVPLEKIGRIQGHGDTEYLEPIQPSGIPESIYGFECVVEAFDGNPLIEWVDMMQYGFLGRGPHQQFPKSIPGLLNSRTQQIRRDDRASSWRRGRRLHSHATLSLTSVKSGIVRPWRWRSVASLQQHHHRRTNPDRSTREPPALAGGHS